MRSGPAASRSRRTPWLIVIGGGALLLVLAALVARFLSDAEVEDWHPAAAPNAEGVDAGAEVRRRREDETPPTRTVDSGPADPATGGNEIPVALPPPTGPRIRLIAAATNAPPLATLAVRFLPLSGLPAGERHYRIEEALQSQGVRLDVRADGIVVLPEFAGQALVTAAGSALYGERIVEHEETLRDPPVELRLEEDDALMVSTVDPAGRPVADVPIALFLDNRRAKMLSSRFETPGRFVLWTGRTDDRGQAAIRRVRARHDAFVQPGFENGQRVSALIDAGQELFVGLDLPPLLGNAGGLAIRERDWYLPNPGGANLAAMAGAPAERRPVRKDAAGHLEPIRLVVEEGGSLEIRFLDAASRPLDRTVVWVAQRGLGTARNDLPDPDADLEIGGSAPITVRGGVLRLEHLPLGIWFPMTAMEPTGAFEPVEGLLQSALEAGTTRRYDIVFREPRPQLTFRVLDTEGAPLAATALRVEVAGEGDNELQVDRLPTDPEGRLVLSLPRKSLGGANVEIRIGIVRPGGSIAAAAVRVIGTPAGSGLNELADFQLQPARILVAGRLTRSSAAPLGNAAVIAWRDGFGAEIHLRDRDRGSPFTTSRAEVDAEGRFSIESPLLRGRWRLLAIVHGIERDLGPFEAGQAGLEFDLP